MNELIEEEVLQEGAVGGFPSLLSENNVTSSTNNNNNTSLGTESSGTEDLRKKKEELLIRCSDFVSNGWKFVGE